MASYSLVVLNLRPLATLVVMAWARQRDGVTCGPSVAVMAGALLDREYGSRLFGPRAAAAQQWFDAEQGRVHRAVNMVWPRALGTTPAGMARAITERSASRGVRYRWRPARRADVLADVSAALRAGMPVAMLIGATIPRHWVLLTEIDGSVLRCYEPSTGHLHAVPMAAIRESRLDALGFPRAFAFVLPGESG
jgi:hypothetical protein